MAGLLRIGIVGAGRVVRERHLPGFGALPGVRVVGICNRKRDASVRLAREWGIPRVFESWESLVEDDEVDAVVVGTWPSLHCPITLAALDAGKHVLTQGRMAMNAREAQRMLDRSRECRHLAAMVAPTPMGLAGDDYVRGLIAEGLLGTLREVHVRGLSGTWSSRRTPIDWRQITRYSGFNMLNLGELHEAALRWTAPAVQVLARAAITIPVRDDPETGEPARVGTPDTVQVLTTHRDESIGVYRLSGVVCHKHGTAIELYGSRGSLVYDLQNDSIRAGRAGKADASRLDPRRPSRRLAGRGRIRRRDPRRDPRHPARLHHRRPDDAVHRGRRPQFPGPVPRRPPPPRILQRRQWLSSTLYVSSKQVGHESSDDKEWA